jgi:hypothetical protein
MWSILTGEFFWGIVIGLILSFLGGWVLASFTVKLTQKNQKQVVRNFCIDIIQNLQNIVRDMDATTTRAQAIHHDFLALIDIEISIYGRNREHLIHLPEQVRNEVRKFMNECAIKKAEVASRLDQFYRLNSLADQIQAEGHAPDAERTREQAMNLLSEARRASDKLVAVANSASETLNQLRRL